MHLGAFIATFLSFFFFPHLAQITMDSLSEAAALLSIGSAISIHFIKRRRESRHRERGGLYGRKMAAISVSCCFTAAAQLSMEASGVQSNILSMYFKV